MKSVWGIAKQHELGIIATSGLWNATVWRNDKIESVVEREKCWCAAASPVQAEGNTATELDRAWLENKWN